MLMVKRAAARLLAFVYVLSAYKRFRRGWLEGACGIRFHSRRSLDRIVRDSWEFIAGDRCRLQLDATVIRFLADANRFKSACDQVQFIFRYIAHGSSLL